MSVSLSVVFTGLCALVSNGDGRPGEVLLLEAGHVGEVHGITLPAHSPTLVVSLNDLANPDSSFPSQVIVGRAGPRGPVEQFGVWDLRGSHVRIRAQGDEGSGLRFFRPDPAETSWPEPPLDPNDPKAWRDMRFVPAMGTLVGDGRIDASLVDSGATTLPRSLAARMHLDAGILEAGIPSQPTYRDEMFEFKRDGSEPSVRQALTDTVHWTLESAAAAVVIDITPVTGGTAKRLLFAPSATTRRLYVSNLPSENSSHMGDHQGMSAEEMATLHFGAYYNLLLNEPTHKPLPTPWRPVDKQKGSGLIRPATCGPAVFSRP